MNEHTPGPWAVPKIDSQRHGGDLTIEARTKIYHNPRYIGRVYGPGVLASMDAETRANARLIAAAPELLAALGGVLAIAADPAADENEDAVEVTLARICQDARAAIAKAKEEE